MRSKLTKKEKTSITIDAEKRGKTQTDSVIYIDTTLDTNLITERIYRKDTCVSKQKTAVTTIYFTDLYENNHVLSITLEAARGLRKNLDLYLQDQERVLSL